MDPYRALIYQIIHEGIAQQEYEKILQLSWQYRFTDRLVIERKFRGNDSDLTEFCSFLFSQGIVKKGDLSRFKALLGGIRRYDLVRQVWKFELQEIIRRCIYAACQTTHSLITLERWIVFRMVFLQLYFVIGFYLYRKYHLDLYLVLVLAAIWGFYAIKTLNVLRYKYRFFVCTWGCIPNSFMSFRFLTFDLQEVDVVDNTEFEWEILKFRLGLKFKPRPFSRYFLNTNRCILGDVQRTSNSLDGVKPVRGAEIFAVDYDGNNIYYHSGEEWYRYKSAKRLTFHTTMKYGFSWLHGHM